jgi:hypothetical protein
MDINISHLLAGLKRALCPGKSVSLVQFVNIANRGEDQCLCLLQGDQWGRYEVGLIKVSGMVE